MEWREISFKEACRLYSSGGNLRIQSKDGTEYWERVNGESNSNSPGNALIGSQGPSNRNCKFFTC